MLHIGVAGWDHPHWYGTVYPKYPSRHFHPLEYLAERVDLADISSTFHHYARPELTRLWLRQAEGNPRFRFTARLHRDFTHERNFDAGRIQQFHESMMPLLDQGRLGAVVMQFPNSFRLTEENRNHLIRLRRSFHRFPLLAELRHSSWTCPEGLGTLIDYRIGIVNLDQPEGFRATAPGSHLTTGTGGVKLHGRVCGASFDQFEEGEGPTGNNYLYSLAELNQWKSRVERMMPFSDDLYVVFNNDGGGKSVVNALQFQSLLANHDRGATREDKPSRQGTLLTRTAA